jgi:hypothetical protein
MFFLVGRERSGTTLLKAYLDAHPNICMPVEILMILYLHKDYFQNGGYLNEKKLSKLADDLFKAPGYWKLGLKEEELKQAICAVSEDTFANTIKRIYSFYNHKYGNKSIQLLGDKNPSHAMFIELLMKVFPEAKFLVIVRDYHTQIHSMRGVHFETRNVASLAVRWAYYYQPYLKFKSIKGNQFYCINFESLVKNPQIELQGICHFLNVPYNPEMIEKKGERLKDFIIYEKAIHQSTIGENNLKKTEFNPANFKKRQIEIMEILAGETGEKFGYQKTINTPKVKKYLLLLYYTPGIIYGKLYVTLAKGFIKLPLSIRLFLVKKLFPIIFFFRRSSLKKS